MGQFDLFHQARCVLAGVALVASVPFAAAQTSSPSIPELPAEPAEDHVEKVLDLDLDQLSQADVSISVPVMDTVVSTVSRQESTVGRSPAAVFVITQEMIQRSGVNHVPELLRMVPGVQVARIDANKWMITARGFNNRLANKLLVQIDGRSVYNQAFAGVYWQMHDLVLEDIERIEVIRGPGGTVWGANAVNGVINIITKHSADTQGVLVTGGSGTEERGFGTVRYGGQASRDLHWRAYGKFREVDSGYLPGEEAHDDWRGYRTGFRADWATSPCDTVMVQGDAFEQALGWSSAFTGPFFGTPSWVDVPSRGSNASVRWKRDLGEDSDMQFQAYVDEWSIGEPTVRVGEERTLNVDFQHNFRTQGNHNIIYGWAYRNVRSDIIMNGPLYGTTDPEHLTTDLYSCFLQDEIALVEDRWYLTLGSKFEHNDFTGFEYQPSARLLFLPTERQSVWAAVSRAVRTPSRVELHMQANMLSDPVGPVFLSGFPNPNLNAEDVLAVELGYRSQPHDDFSWDIAGFYNRYEDLVSRRADAPFFDPVLGGTVIPTYTGNFGAADTYGVELSSTVVLSHTWQLTGAYTCLQINAAVPQGDTTEQLSPHNQLYLRSAWTPSRQWNIDAYFRYVDSLPIGISSYNTIDLRVAYAPTRHFEWAVVGRNLLDPHHLEGTDAHQGVYPTEIQREIFTTLTWKR